MSFPPPPHLRLRPTLHTPCMSGDHPYHPFQHPCRPHHPPGHTPSMPDTTTGTVQYEYSRSTVGVVPNAFPPGAIAAGPLPALAPAMIPPAALPVPVLAPVPASLAVAVVRVLGLSRANLCPGLEGNIQTNQNTPGTDAWRRIRNHKVRGGGGCCMILIPCYCNENTHLIAVADEQKPKTKNICSKT